MTALLEAKDLHKVYETASTRVEVLKGIDVSLQAGDQYVIVGASGSGKSTLLHLLGGLDSPSKGRVFFQGESLDEKTDQDLSSFRNLHLGFVFQFHHLLPLFSAWENVMMPCLISGKSKSESRERSAHLLQEMGLSHRLSHRPHELSGGEQQRVAIARALVMEPQILMADEPTGNLDTETSETVFEQLMLLQKKRNTTLLLVTHNEMLAQRMKHRVRIQDGRLSHL